MPVQLGYPWGFEEVLGFHPECRREGGLCMSGKAVVPSPILNPQTGHQAKSWVWFWPVVATLPSVLHHQSLTAKGLDLY